MTGGARLDRAILRLALPGVLASLSVPLIGLADTAMVGHLPDIAFLGAIAAASTLFDILFWSVGFLRMGTTSIVSHHHGAGDRRGCTATLYRALAIALAIGLGAEVLRAPLSEVGFRLVGGTEAVQVWGQRYFDVRILGVPLVLMTLALNGFFLGTANAVAPLAVTVVTNLVNLGADYALIFGRWGAPELGVVGAAWAAVVANACGLAVGLGILLLRYRAYVLAPLPEALLDPAQLRHLLSTNLNLFGRTLCLLFAQFSLVALVARLGEVPLAAHTVVWQLWSVVSYGVDGFAHAAEALVGGSLGLGDRGLARAYAQRLLRWGVGIGAVFGAVYALGLPTLSGLLTRHREVVAAAASLTVLVAAVQPLNGAVFVFDGIFIGANDTRYLFRAMALSAFGVYVPVLALLVGGFEGELLAAWTAYASLMAARAASLAWRYRTDAWLGTFLHQAFNRG